MTARDLQQTEELRECAATHCSRLAQIDLLVVRKLRGRVARHVERICGALECQSWARMRAEETLRTWEWLYHLERAEKTTYCPELPPEIAEERLMLQLEMSITRLT